MPHEDKPLTNSMEIVLTDTDKLQIALATTKQDLVRAKQVIASAAEALSCAGASAKKDRAVQAAAKVLQEGRRSSS